MDNESDKNLYDNLTELGEVCLETVASQWLAKKLQPSIDIVNSWKGKSYEYQLDKGLVCTQWEGRQEMVPTWSVAVSKVIAHLHKHPIYPAVVAQATEQFPKRASSYAIDQFIAFISRQFLAGTQNISEIPLNQIVDRLILDFEGKPVRYMLIALIRGVTLESQQLKLSESITIRRPTREDVEKTSSMSELQGHDRITLTSSMVLEMEIDLPLTERNAIRQILDTYTCLLRLFGTGTVNYLKFDLDSNAVLRNAGEGTLASNLMNNDIDTYCIYQSDERRFLDFCDEFFKRIPRDFDRSRVPATFLTIAYGRYNDSLVKREIIEKRIASATMGLEALFTTDKQEILYKLYQRLAKVFSFLGKKSVDTIKTIKHAYAIRSSYVHGGHLADKEKNKLVERYGSLDAFTLELLEYLRISIVLYFRIDMENDKFVPMIDAAMVDEASNDALKKALLPVAPHIQKLKKA